MKILVASLAPIYLMIESIKENDKVIESDLWTGRESLYG